MIQVVDSIHGSVVRLAMFLKHVFMKHLNVHMSLIKNVITSSLDLSSIQVPILTKLDCQEKVQGNETIQSSMLCAGGEGCGANKVG